MSRTLDEVVQGFRQMSSTLGMTPPGVTSVPTPAGVPVPQALPFPAFQLPTPPAPPAAVSATMAPGTYGIPQFDYSGLAHTQQSFQMANAFGGMGPSPALMTPPAYGIFRPPPVVASVSPGMVPAPTHPYSLQQAPSYFTPPGEHAANFAMMHMRQQEMRHFAMLDAGTRVASGGATAFLSGNMGMFLGGALGGARGMALGGMAGGLAGFGLGSYGPIGNFASSMYAAPRIHEGLAALREQEASARFFAGAPGVGGSMMHMSAADSTKVVRELSNFADKSRGQFNRRDMMNIMQGAGDAGLLDFAANADTIIRHVKTVSKVVAAMAQITHDPDIRRNLKLLGDMQRMGSTPMETLDMLSKLRASGRMAGVDVASYLQNEGQAGAAMFQGAGLLPSAGAGAMLYGAGQAKNAVASGAVSPTLAALLGGQSGMAQEHVQAAAGFLAGPGKMILASLLTDDGSRLDPGAVDRFRSKPIDWQDTYSRGVANIANPKALENFFLRQNELLAELVKKLGPEGIDQALIKVGRAVRDMYGLQTTGMGLMQLGVDSNYANALDRMSSSRTFIENNRRQMEYDLAQDRMRRAQLNRQGRSFAGAWFDSAWAGVHLNPFASGDYTRFEDREEEEDKVYEARGAKRIRSGVQIWGDQKKWLEIARSSPGSVYATPRATAAPGSITAIKHAVRESAKEELGVFDDQIREWMASGGWREAIVSPLAMLGGLSGAAAAPTNMGKAAALSLVASDPSIAGMAMWGRLANNDPAYLKKFRERIYGESKRTTDLLGEALTLNVGTSTRNREELEKLLGSPDKASQLIAEATIAYQNNNGGWIRKLNRERQTADDIRKAMVDSLKTLAPGLKDAEVNRAVELAGPTALGRVFQGDEYRRRAQEIYGDQRSIQVGREADRMALLTQSADSWSEQQINTYAGRWAVNLRKLTNRPSEDMRGAGQIYLKLWEIKNKNYQEADRLAPLFLLWVKVTKLNDTSRAATEAVSRISDADSIAIAKLWNQLEAREKKSAEFLAKLFQIDTPDEVTASLKSASTLFEKTKEGGTMYAQQGILMGAAKNSGAANLAEYGKLSLVSGVQKLLGDENVKLAVPDRQRLNELLSDLNNPSLPEPKWRDAQREMMDILSRVAGDELWTVDSGGPDKNFSPMSAEDRSRKAYADQTYKSAVSDMARTANAMAAAAKSLENINRALLHGNPAILEAGGTQYHSPEASAAGGSFFDGWPVAGKR